MRYFLSNGTPIDAIPDDFPHSIQTAFDLGWEETDEETFKRLAIERNQINWEQAHVPIDQL